MKLTYDPRYNIAYLRLHKKKAKVETIRVSDELNVDIAPDGTVYGIELLNATSNCAPKTRGILSSSTKRAASARKSGWRSDRAL